jgi:hypothetical protein
MVCLSLRLADFTTHGLSLGCGWRDCLQIWRAAADMNLNQDVTRIPYFIDTPFFFKKKWPTENWGMRLIHSQTLVTLLTFAMCLLAVVSHLSMPKRRQVCKVVICASTYKLSVTKQSQ